MFKRAKRNIIANVIESNLDYLVRFAFFRLGSRMEAEDLVHDAILKFLEKNSAEIKPESGRLYLFRIVRNLCIDRLHNREKHLNLTENLEIEDNIENILDLEDAKRINACLDSIPERESEIIRMRVIDNLSFSYISKIISVPQSTVKSRYKSGMDKLKKQVGNFEI